MHVTSFVLFDKSFEKANFQLNEHFYADVKTLFIYSNSSSRGQRSCSLTQLQHI